MRLLDPKKFCSINSGVWRSFWKLVKALKFRVINLVRRSCECDGLLGYSLAQMRLHNWLNHFKSLRNFWNQLLCWLALFQVIELSNFIKRWSRELQLLDRGRYQFFFVELRVHLGADMLRSVPFSIGQFSLWCNYRSLRADKCRNQGLPEWTKV